MDLDIDLNLNLEECNMEIVQHESDNLSDTECLINLEPYIGMQFDSQDGAYSFYSMYAKSIGFGISTKANRRSNYPRHLENSLM